jgi:hypothetical protein
MNIAFLIGVSRYATESQLPACALDVENLYRLLCATQKYDDIQKIAVNTTANNVKDSLREFFAKHRNGAPVSEALIYFSGHGIFQNDALFCCSDFDISKPATTSISNAELDDLLRSVNPEVAVKVIDACQSGSSYIKDASNGFEKSIRTSRLNSFICMASSRQEQSSYATATESDFTSRWIDSALSKSQGTIFYRDIQSALADAFAANPDQTPFFVNQGTALEAFSTVNEEMRALRALRSKASLPADADDDIAKRIEAAIRKREEQFVPHNEALAAIAASKKLLLDGPITDLVVSRFYEKVAIADLRLSAIPLVRGVAAFAEEQGWPKKYFVKINNEAYRTRIPKKTIVGVDESVETALRAGSTEFRIETRFRAANIESTEPLPFEVAEIAFVDTAHSTLASFKVYLGIVHSLTEVMVLSATVRLLQKGWKERTPALSDVQWRYQAYSWKTIVNDPSSLWREALARSEADIRTYLESLIGKPDSSPADPDATIREAKESSIQAATLPGSTT